MKLVRYKSDKKPDVVVQSDQHDINEMIDYLGLTAYAGAFYYDPNHIDNLGINDRKYYDYYKILKDNEDISII